MPCHHISSFRDFGFLTSGEPSEDWMETCACPHDRSLTSRLNTVAPSLGNYLDHRCPAMSRLAYLHFALACSLNDSTGTGKCKG
jgi:hypothetical protein